MQEQATRSYLSIGAPLWSPQRPFFLLAEIWAAALLACVASLWYRHHDAVAGVAALLTLALLVSGFAAIRRSWLRSDARQHALEHEIEQNTRLFDTSLDLILVTDRQGRFLRVSPSAKAILDYRPEEMVGHIGIDFIHPDDLIPPATKCVWHGAAARSAISTAAMFTRKATRSRCRGPASGRSPRDATTSSAVI